MSLDPITTAARASRSRGIAYLSVAPFVLVHLGCVAAIWTGVSWTALALCAGLYWLRMFGVTAGYHRYFSHRAFATSRPFQLVLAILAQSSAQKSVLWWAAKHRHHHLHSDRPEDVHSPAREGFLYSHVGWIFARRHAGTDLAKVPDLARYPELMWLHKHEIVPALVLGGACFLAAGWSGLVVGFLWSSVLVYHATFCINSLAHVRGRKRYVTGDDSRNNAALALLTMGEGWHNNHHAYPSSARQGFRWWEVDMSWYILLLLEKLGIVWDVKAPSPGILRNERPLGAPIVERTAEQLAARFNPERIAHAIASALPAAELSRLREAIAHGQHRAGETLAKLHLTHIPTRAELTAQAKAMFARTPSLDEIVDRCHELLLASIWGHLAPAGVTANGQARQQG